MYIFILYNDSLRSKRKSENTGHIRTHIAIYNPSLSKEYRKESLSPCMWSVMKDTESRAMEIVKLKDILERIFFISFREVNQIVKIMMQSIVEFFFNIVVPVFRARKKNLKDKIVFKPISSTQSMR